MSYPIQSSQCPIVDVAREMLAEALGQPKVLKTFQNYLLGRYTVLWGRCNLPSECRLLGEAREDDRIPIVLSPLWAPARRGLNECSWRYMELD